ncbi:TPA: hypothetical protein N0F65_007160, partial [Lagenidium giganteum]
GAAPTHSPVQDLNKRDGAQEERYARCRTLQLTPSTALTPSMGPPPPGGRKMRQEEYDSDDAESLASVETGRTYGSEDADFYETYTKDEGDEIAIDEAVEELTERRGSTRVAAMQTLTGHLLQYLPPDSVSESFVSNIISCLRKPSEQEAVLGSRMLAVISLIFGADEERHFQRTRAVLEPLVKTSRSEKVKCMSIRALAMSCFVCSVEDENIAELVRLYDRFFDLKITASICIAALESWGLMASSLVDSEVCSEDYIDRFLPKFLTLLDHTDVGVRSAAGENIALMYESAQKCHVVMPCDVETLERFRVMSKESSKKNSKKDRKVQRSVFRDVHATLETGESPQVSFALKGEMIDIQSWRAVKQFEAIKECLQTGLQQHIKFNNNVRQILDMPETLEERVIDRRDMFDKKSSARKQRSNELKGERRRKINMQESFLGDY